jgi:type III secretion system FlhB-like substrate exporter
MRHSFNWVFREFISRKSPYALASRLGKSEKLIYAWAQEESSPFYRKDPLSYALNVLRVINDHIPELAYRALSEIARELGYRLEPYPSSGEREVLFHQVLKELNEAEEALANPENDIEEDLREVEEAIYTLLLKKAELLRKLEKAEREGKNPPRRR